MHPVDKHIQFFQDLNDLASNFERTHDNSYLEKMNSLITKRLLFFTASEMDQLDEIKEKLLKAKVDPKEKIIWRIQAISESLRNGLTFIGLSEFSDVFPKQILRYLPLQDLISIQRLSPKLHSDMQNDLPKTMLEFYASKLPIDKLIEFGTQADKSLTHLDLTNQEDLTSDDLKELVKLFPDLQTINLKNCGKITDKGLSHLAKLINLRQLDLTWCSRITNKGLSHIAKLTGLQQLNLTWCSKITDKGLKAIAILTNLQQLNLAGCSQITDEGLEVLTKLTNLQQLNLARCSQITDEGLEVFTKLPNLRQLDLRDCWLVTDEGRKLLLNSFPNLKLI